MTIRRGNTTWWFHLILWRQGERERKKERKIERSERERETER
jgi:hypothetical protein